jgi:CheY-like chemotaxis protein/signal transduction histidine kinase
MPSSYLSSGRERFSNASRTSRRIHLGHFLRPLSLLLSLLLPSMSSAQEMTTSIGSSASLGISEWISESALNNLLALNASPMDYTVASFLLGCIGMLVFINLGQSILQRQLTHLWFGLYSLLMALAIFLCWAELIHILPQDFGRNFASHLLFYSMSANLLFCVSFSSNNWQAHNTHKILIIISLLLLPVPTGLLWLDSQLAFAITRNVLLVTSLFALFYAISLNKHRYSKHLVIAKTLTLAIYTIIWVSTVEAGSQLSLTLWALLLMVLLESTIITYVLVRNNIINTSQRLRNHYRQTHQRLLKQQYAETLRRVDHEMRTPISGVIGISEILLESSLTKGQRDQAQTIRRSGDALLKWLNRLGDWRILQHSKLTFDALPFEFPNLVSALCDDVTLKAEDRKINFTYHIDKRVPELVRGDSARVKQIITGIIELALYYSEQGEMELHVTPGKSKTHWQVHLHDTQTGLTANDMQFTDYNQTLFDAGNFTSIQRHWLIAEALAKHMDGYVRHTLNRDGSADFSAEFKLPRHTLLQHSVNQYDELLNGKRLLVVDDSSSSRKIVAKRADRWGMKVSSVPSGADALSMLNTLSQIGGHYHAIILDQDMPGMTGMELAKTIHNSPLSENTIMIMLSGASTVPSKEEARAVGITRVLSKPINAKTLKITLAEEMTLALARRSQVVDELVV